mmetsp:Transcript_38254/g.123802  ORF Transcript_38254/g.123802 Transcript_38254/m.123802 type:complete len:201 (-) Transcript_38254:304-906(-)
MLHAMRSSGSASPESARSKSRTTSRAGVAAAPSAAYVVASRLTIRVRSCRRETTLPPTMRRKTESALRGTPWLSESMSWARSGGSMGTDPPRRSGSASASAADAAMPPWYADPARSSAHRKRGEAGEMWAATSATWIPSSTPPSADASIERASSMSRVEALSTETTCRWEQSRRHASHGGSEPPSPPPSSPVSAHSSFCG